ncbi:MAG: hypothetical protein HOP19_19460 [Acidobacteria bacterium]|nr:hypothetical protein [Acidobacteriota bacterium]
MSTLAAAPALQPAPALAVGSILLPHKPRVLLIGDQPERLLRLRRSLGNELAEFVTVSTLSELPGALSRGGVLNYAFAVVDFDSAYVAQTLTTLRANHLTHAIPVLVDADRLGDSLQLAGVLPQYRAMACARHELLALAQQRLQKPQPIAEPLQRLL